MSVNNNVGLEYLLKCPICMELPKREVYQCLNGHPICAECCVTLTRCPQCRVPFEESKIRNRVAEGLLENLELMCPYRKDGCPLKFRRKDLDEHNQSCDFRPVNICKILGWRPQCTYAASLPVLMLKHFADTHEVKLLRCDPLIYSSRSCLYTYPNEQLPVCAQLVPWETIVLGSLKRFLICTFFNRNGKGAGEMSFLCVLLNTESKLASRFMLDVEMKIADKNVRWKWRGISTQHRELQDCDVRSVLDRAPLRIPMNCLNSEDFKYSVNVSVTSIK